MGLLFPCQSPEESALPRREVSSLQDSKSVNAVKLDFCAVLAATRMLCILVGRRPSRGPKAPKDNSKSPLACLKEAMCRV